MWYIILYSFGAVCMTLHGIIELYLHRREPLWWTFSFMSLITAMMYVLLIGIAYNRYKVEQGAEDSLSPL